jgi:CHAT domain-containing protein
MRMAAARLAVIAAGLLRAAAQDTSASLEARAAEAFDKRDCATALRLYTAALNPAKSAAQWSKAALYYRRIGICAYRVGDIEAAWNAYHAGVGMAESAKDDELLMENLHGSSVALRHLGRLNDAMEAAERALVLAERCQHPPHLSRGLSQVALLASDMGQAAKAQRFLQRQLEVARANHDREGVEVATENLALQYGSAGDPETGILLLREALAQIPSTDETVIGRFQANMGMLSKLAGRFDEAQALYEDALRHTSRPEAWRSRHVLLYNMGLLAVDRGNLVQARKSFEECLKVVNGRDPHVEAMSKEALAGALLDMHQPGEALRVALDAVAVARRSESPMALFPALATLGRIYDAAERYRDAGPVLEEAAAIVESLRAASPGDPTALEAVHKQGHPVYQTMVSHLLAEGRAEEALVWAEKAKARVLNELLLKGGLDERSAMTEEERRQERVLYGKVSRAAADRQKSIAAIGELETFRRELYTRHPELALQRADFAPAGPAEWRKLLPDSHSALLEYFQLHDAMVLFVVREKGVRVVRLKLEAASLQTEVRAYRDQLAARDVNYRAAARALYRKLLAPAAAELAGTGNWILSPDGVLWELPFQTLIDEGGRHALETHALSYTPSLTALWGIRRRPARQTSSLELLSVGNSSVPQAQDEARRIAGLYTTGKTLVLTGAEASQDRFREQAPRAGIIHIATHAQLNSANPMYSTLALSPGTLPATELLRMPLHARLAVLSACETARAKASQGEELLGMGWALTGAGASASVVSQWKVDSAATETLMVAFHRNLRKPLPAAEALRRAALEVRGMQGDRNPFYWAAFLVLGDGFR